MKKTIKTTIAMLLALVMACGSMTAFAASSADISWSFWEDATATVYSYAGELTVGADAVEVSTTEDNNFIYCTFAAEEDGYYKISSTYNSTDWMGIPEKYENGVYYGVKLNHYGGENLRERYCYLEAGEYVIGFDFYEQGSEEVSVEFMGDIVEVVYGEGTFDNLFLGYNVYDYYYDDGSEADYSVGASVIVKFENGEDLGIDYTELLIYTDGELKAGENAVEIGIYAFEYKEAMTLTILDAKELIAKVELSNIERYTELVEHYEGSVYCKESTNGTLTVTYADGTTETVEDFDGYGYLEKYCVNVYDDYSFDNNGNLCFTVSVAGETFVNEVCTVEAASAFDNIGTYNSLNVSRIASAFDWMGYYLNRIFTSDSLAEAFDNIGNFFTDSASDWLYAFAYIMRNTADFISYMF